MKSISSMRLTDQSTLKSPVGPTSLTIANRYDSEASLTSLESMASFAGNFDSTQSVANSTVTNGTVTPKRPKLPGSPSLGFNSVRALFSGKKSRPARPDVSNVLYDKTSAVNSLPPFPHKY